MISIRHSAVSGRSGIRQRAMGGCAAALLLCFAAAAQAETADPSSDAAAVPAASGPSATPAEAKDPGEKAETSKRADEPAEEAPAANSPPAHFSMVYRGDVQDVASGGVQRGARYVDNLIVSGDFDLDRLVGLKGVTAHIDVMHNFGGVPTDLAGSLLGVNGDEQSIHRLRLAQAWVQDSFAGGKASVLVGFYDVSSEFDVTDSSGLLIGTSFGTSPEFDSSGPAGPSGFPSTSFGVRLRLQPKETEYAVFVVANAHAAALGDPGGPDFTFSDGLLLAGEVGYTGWGKVAVGAWRYSKPQPGVRVPFDGVEETHVSQGIYGLVEHALNAPKDGVRKVTLFGKVGVSDGRTTAFHGAWQAGVLVDQVFKSRPESQFSAGVSQGRLSRGFRDNGRDEGLDVGSTETAFEATYSDKLTPQLAIQPDVQWIHRPSGDAGVKDALVIALRLTVSF
jgi:porin